ncbi:hypothetical protein U1Q18_005433 [Sarracenia purpurea var. burkii]
MPAKVAWSRHTLAPSILLKRACRFADDHFKLFLADWAIGVIDQTSLREILPSGLTSLIYPLRSLWTNPTSPGRHGSPAISVRRTRDAVMVSRGCVGSSRGRWWQLSAMGWRRSGEDTRRRSGITPFDPLSPVGKVESHPRARVTFD